MAKFKVKTGRNLFDRLLVGVLKLIKKNPEVVDLNDNPLEEKSILIANHSGASGPVTYKSYINHRIMLWGAHQMRGRIKVRWNYLYHTFYRQKLGYSKFKSFNLACLLSVLYPIVVRHAGIIPIYYDMRIKFTYQYSVDCLDKNVSVLIFPENSDGGYQERMVSFWPGFLQFSKFYFKKYQVDLPIYTLYYNKKRAKIVIGKPMYLQELLKTYSETDVLRIFMDYMNELNDVHIESLAAQEETAA